MTTSVHPFAHPIDHREQDSQLTVTAVAWAHGAIVLMALLVAVIGRTPAALALAGPSLVIISLTLLSPRIARVDLSMELDRPRVIEGDTIELSVRLQGPSSSPVVSVEFTPEPRLEPVGPLHTVFSSGAKSVETAAFRFRATAWGVAQIGHVSVMQRDRFGLLALHQLVQITDPVRVHIREEEVRSLAEPDRFRRYVGSHLSGERGEGCEFADVRPYQPGDRLQTLNWRISARQDEPWITLRHPDRSTSVVVMLDATTDLGGSKIDDLRRGVQAALGLARLHVAAQDPVGVLLVGGGMRWIEPALGREHLYRIADVMLDLSQPTWWTRPRSNAMADRMVPADAVIVAVSGLEDARFVEMLTELRASGRPVQVVQPIVDWRNYLAQPWRDPYAWRIRSLAHEARRRRFRDSGIIVHPWPSGQPFEAVLRAMRLRGRARLASRAST
ncbi:MAG: DUF58 domain-containing protein [Actinomycetota bacterium]